jgi:serine/threonine protein kinase
LVEYSSLQERLLEDRTRQIEELESVWCIHEWELCNAVKIDMGAFGEVFKARWRDVDVAVKRIKANATELNADAAAEFQREIAFMRTLRHANLVLFFGCGCGSDGLPFIVCEFVPRGTLKRVLADPLIEILSERKLYFVRGSCSFCILTRLLILHFADRHLPRHGIFTRKGPHAPVYILGFNWFFPCGFFPCF